MAQFHAYENPNKATRRTYPYLLDIQSDLLDGLHTTVVVPLCPEHLAASAAITRLNPIVELQGKRFVLLIPQVAGIDRKYLGQHVADLSDWRTETAAALDVLISGV